MVVILLGVGIVGLSGAMVVAKRSQVSSRERLIACRALQNQIEEIGESDFNQIASTYDGRQFEIPLLKTGSSTTTYGTPTGRVTVVAVDPRRLQVTVTGTWNGENGPQSFQLYQEFSQ